MLRSTFVMFLMLIVAGGAVAGDWAETVKVNGDFRYRHENIDEDGMEVRNRHRVRVRIGLSADVEENLSVDVRVLTGSDNPIGTNQTLDGAFTTKPIGLDRASFAWKHPDSGMKVQGGKMGMPFFRPAKSELIWDSDLSPEGLAAAWGAGSDATKLFVRAAGLWIDERAADTNASLMGAQAGLTHTADAVKLTVGGAVFKYDELDGPIYRDGDLEIDDDFFGNTNAAGDFLTGFELLEAFIELGFQAGDMPVTVYADFVTNTEADDLEQGYIFGAKFNKAKEPGSWAAGYNYRELQADAVMGALTNSDFLGGGTDGKGHMVNFAYQASDAAQFALTYLMDTKGLENGHDFKRLQADLKIKF